MAAPKFLRRPLAFRDRFRPWVIRRTVRNTYEGIPRRHRKLCFFASYSATSELSPYLLAYLGELHRCGLDIVFCTTSEQLDAEQISELTEYCHYVIHRTNTGHDFASWKACFALFPQWRAAEALLITNDSVLGPLQPLGGIFARIDGSAGPCWGLNDSHERAYHLQSFFLYFKAEALAAGRFRRFWQGVSLLTEKYDIVKFYEVGLTRQLQRAGLVCQALFPSAEVQDYCRSLGSRYQYPDVLGSAKFNASLYAAYEMVEGMEYPFIKSDLIRNDRYNSRHIDALRERLRSFAENDAPALRD